MIGIRVDANQYIASGHVMRCIAIAQALRQNQQKCIFIVADEAVTKFIEQNNFPFIILNSCWNQLEDEVQQLMEIIRGYDIEALLIDSYYVTNRYLTNLRQVTKVIYIDDLETEVYDVDMIINYSIYCNQKIYREKYNKSVKLLLGTEYAPLRQEFAMSKSSLKRNVKDILITSGATDPYNIIVPLINEMLKDDELKQCRLHVIVGKFYKAINDLEKIQQLNPNIILHKNVSNMAEIMAKSDIGISAGGTTLLELCSCQLPTVSFAFADNQLNGVATYAKKGIIQTVGDIRVNKDESIKALISIVKKLAQNYEERKEIRDKMKYITNGKGAQRIAEEIIYYKEEGNKIWS